MVFGIGEAVDGCGATTRANTFWCWKRAMTLRQQQETTSALQLPSPLHYCPFSTTPNAVALKIHSILCMAN